jgi:hypothetical protein
MDSASKKIVFLATAFVEKPVNNPPGGVLFQNE